MSGSVSDSKQVRADRKPSKKPQSAKGPSGKNLAGKTPNLPPAVAGYAARRVAADILGNVVHRRQTLTNELDAQSGHTLYRELDQKDRALVRAIVSVCLRRRGQIADLLEKLIDRPIPEKTGRAEDILHVAIAQILFLDVADHAAVSLAVTHADKDRKARPYKGLINGVLRRLIREREELLAGQDELALNTPDWLMARWMSAYGAETARKIAAAHLREAALDVTVKADAAGWADRFGGVVLPTGSVRLTLRGSVEKMPGYAKGEWWVQDAAAALPARLLGDVSDKRVADLCAAPGGKTAQLAQAGAEVTAVDLSEARLKRLAVNMKRLKLKAETVTADLADWQPEKPFDAVLLDAPCSATGTIRRHPDLPWLKREQDIAALAEIQATLLDRAAAWVRPGGLLVYCTCSLEPEEGEAQIAALLARSRAWERLPIAPEELAGHAEFLTEAGELRTLPCGLEQATAQLSGLDGFFAVRLRRL